jgi:Sigma-70 factor, region 1.2
MNESESGLNRYMRDIWRFPLLTLQQELELVEKIKKGDGEARERMINSNLRLVVAIAHDYANLGLPLLDLISEGNIGLLLSTLGNGLHSCSLFFSRVSAFCPKNLSRQPAWMVHPIGASFGISHSPC